MKRLDEDGDWVDNGALPDGVTPDDEEYGDMLQDPLPDLDDIGVEELDRYIGTQVELLSGDSTIQGTVVKRSRGHDGRLIGRAHANPLFDTREYEIRYTDGTVDTLTANTIAENMFARIDSEGR